MGSGTFSMVIGVESIINLSELPINIKHGQKISSIFHIKQIVYERKISGPDREDEIH